MARHKKKPWTFTTVYYCPSCGAEKRIAWQRRDRRPEKRGDRFEYLKSHCSNCLTGIPVTEGQIKAEEKLAADDACQVTRRSR